MNLAVLWDSALKPEDSEIKSDHIREAYRAFSELSEFQLYMANYQNFENGSLSRAFSYEHGWEPVSDVEVDKAFDKTGLTEDTICFKQKINSQIPVVNPFEIERICDNKLETSRTFPELSPETFPYSEEKAREMIEEYGQVVIKPVSDFGGEGVKIVDDVENLPEDAGIVQQFKDFSNGISGVVDGVHDLRIIVMGGDQIASLLRTPNSGRISNVSRGGTIRKVPAENVPAEARNLAEKVDAKMSEFGKRFYSVDIGFDQDEEPVLLELNSKPAIVFYGVPRIREWKVEIMKQLAGYLS